MALFTGIVQGQGNVVKVHQLEDFRSISIQFPSGSMGGIQIGASVAINGTCLTVTEIDGDRLKFDIIVETLRATNLGALDLGSRVNFERSARVGDEIGGHNVSGHVCATAEVAAIEDSENNRRITFKVPQQFMKYVLPKGFIAVDGISLTVGEVGKDWFTVYLIPETLRITTLGARVVGDAVNLEVEAQTQAIVDTVENVVARYMSQMQLSTAS
ncbi:riboflavin synthase [Coccomyxa subellipsoidea C-169]|uniref:Riboflavin synthase n=1 Tax=Coccomyxa subellipsoidea (strain C-169) TaxID=574566 RepID=I0YKV3_COCSC|nr:riboflavin synthase [Coccomyxa subellipsoidea C-169]EIE19022.1 riboflavin synthase [Coccomyxa subellipsoidea C-169]|eukprot:XP_005643566.1 riboflavin synthase [Coccomyxa subellipsoidea C-169]